MATFIEKAKIEESESQELENVWYRYQALLDLIKGGSDNDIVLARYEKAYAQYNKLWFALLAKYFTTDYANLGGEYSWGADFNKLEITITK